MNFFDRIYLTKLKEGWSGVFRRIFAKLPGFRNIDLEEWTKKINKAYVKEKEYLSFLDRNFFGYDYLKNNKKIT